VRAFSLQQVRDSPASLHTRQELPVFKTVLRLLLKSQVCLDCFSRHFKKQYWKLTDRIVLYSNYQTIMDVLCLRILIWVYDCFTVLQLIPYSSITKHTVSKARTKKKIPIYLLTSWIKQKCYQKWLLFKVKVCLCLRPRMCSPLCKKPMTDHDKFSLLISS